MADLLVLTGTQQGLLLPLLGDKILLGRGSECDIVIEESMLRGNRASTRAGSVSRKHAVISRVGEDYYIEDGDGRGARSRNNTFVNDRQVPFPGRVPLRNNDRIRICDFLCLFQDGSGADTSVEASVGHESSSSLLSAQPPDRLQVILEISNSLSKTLEIDALLPRIVENLFRLFPQADRGFIVLVDEPSGRLVTHAFKTRRPGGPADARFSVSILRQCLDSVRAVLGNDLAQQFPDSDSVSDLPVRSLMCAPLWSQDGKALGAIQLDTRDAKKKFTPQDLDLLLGVASQASIALCNARLYRDSLVHQRRERDLELARQVQRALLPQQLPAVPGYEFFAYYEPALEVGGDYYDFIPLPGQRLGVLLGDVAGKGVAAAMVMVKFSVEARVCLLTEPDLAAAVRKLNTVMCRVGLSDRFVTLVAAVLDPAAHAVTLVNAGHPSPLLSRRATGAVEEAAPAANAGPPVGIFDGYDYACCRAELLPGDDLLLFSDGVTEAMDAKGRQLKMRGARAAFGGAAHSAPQRGEQLVRAVKQHAAGCAQADDITVVCFGRAGG